MATHARKPREMTDVLERNPLEDVQADGVNTREFLEYVIRLLLLSRNSTERRIVAIHVYSGRSIEDAAERLKIPPKRAEEIFQSVCSSERYALTRRRVFPTKTQKAGRTGRKG